MDEIAYRCWCHCSPDSQLPPQLILVALLVSSCVFSIDKSACIHSIKPSVIVNKIIEIAVDILVPPRQSSPGGAHGW